MESPDFTLIAENLTFAYPGGVPVIDDLGLEIRGGQILGLAGQNGAGKSTLLDLLAGLKKPTRGRVSLTGTSPPAGPDCPINPKGPKGPKGQAKGPADAPNGHSTGPKGRVGRPKVALLPQNVDFFLLGDSPREDLALALGPIMARDREARIDAIAASWDLSDHLDRPVETLSLGQKKRLALASSLATDPRLLLLDEPFSGLDWPGSLRFLEDLKKLPEKNLIVVLATHEPALVADLVSLWLLMKPGAYLLAEPEVALKRLEEFGARPLGR
ncbi:MAG: energy-coupling factor ABC transporter ATP-binding protein [Deltaproteobacteria bacterium]|jgi:biotin transport system ATP-binding protein|nr:energy-coupling factor ABC transporter ATP-binding protein [Deltaproteobacteria bacterium]